MNLEELRTAIASSEDFSWFDGIQVNINYPYLNFSLSLTGITSIYEFVENQIDGWSKKGDDIPNELKSSKDFFETMRKQLIKIVESSNEGARQNIWIDTKNQLETQKRKFIFQAPEVDFLIKVFTYYPKSFGPAFNYILGSPSGSLTNKDDLVGTILAYEFSVKEHSDIANRANAERASLSRIRNEFIQHINDSEKQTSEYLKNANDKFQQYTSQIDELKALKEKAFENWFTSSKTEFVEFSDRADKKIKDLEHTYQELLRLKKPAEYWNRRATVLKREGWIFLRWLIGLLLFGCATLYCLLWLTPEGMLLSFITGSASAIKWSIIYVTFISFLAFGIRALSKTMFSSFHLARDAEEREQLTYVYLAMIKEAAVDEKDKSLIMQSLFSRADTGLLREDSSPTMPGNAVDKVIANK